ncbi:hypothetical protein ACLQ2R_17530 [Streptosporangium sp. DT93]|uniref:hypothetical protein n=1 Tax=Streptosporangium sp. DT93 TaxID=3393428 RepID=UPI003CF47109
MTAPERIYWTWVQVVRRAELGFGEGKKRVGSDTVQHIALIAATYGNPDGTRVRPSVDRLARVTRKDEKTVRNCLGRLRDVGLMVRVFEGSLAGRGGKADEYRLAIPDDLLERVAMLDVHEANLFVPDGVAPPPARGSRKRPDGGRREAPNLGSPGAAPAVMPVDNPVDNSETPGAAPADNRLPTSNHRVLPPGTPGAAPKNTGCSTRPPIHRPPIDLPHTLSSPYGAEVEGETPTRREPSAEHDSQPPGTPLANLAPADLDAAYAAAFAALNRLPDFGHTLLAAARAELGDDAPRAHLVIRAHQLAPTPERRTA